VSLIGEVHQAHAKLVRNRTVSPPEPLLIARAGAIVKIGGENSAETTVLARSGGGKAVTFSEVDQRFYAISRGSLNQIDAHTGESQLLNPPHEVPPFSWLGGIAYDTKRGRILVTTSWHTGVHHAYDPITHEWRVFPVDKTGGGLHAIAYHRAHDPIYGLGGGGLRIFDGDFNPRETISLSHPKALGALAPDVDVQMTAVKNGLVVCSTPEHFWNRRPMRCFLVDLPSGEMHLLDLAGRAAP